MLPDDRTAPDIDDPERAGSHYRVHAFWEGGHARAWLAPNARISVGRAEDCDIVIDHASVSRRHAELSASPELSVRDLGSSNGVRVAGTRIAADVAARLAPGVVVQLGGAIVVVHAPPARGSPGPRPLQREASATFERLLELVAPAAINVLLLGETGAGKNVAAERIHRSSPRTARPFVAVNCAAFPEQLLESELFGYERGAFTGAVKAKLGYIEAADGGTLLLDEIGEMPLATQAKLLAVLDTRLVQRLGSTSPRRVDVRFIAATNRDLEIAVLEGNFRQDLYFRLNGVRIEVPPLRERREAIAELALRFAREAAHAAGRPEPELGSDTLARLEAHAWPGNVRELKNAVERAIVLSGGSHRLSPEHFELRTLARPTSVAADAATPNGCDAPARHAAPRDLRGEIAALERERIIAALDAAGGNQTRAAKALGIARRTLIHRIEEFGLSRPRKR